MMNKIDVTRHKTDYDMAVRLNSEAAQIELEFVLASLMYPHYSISYDENGHYWKMNDTRFPLPNFKGYVPKWLRDDAASFELMVSFDVYPFVRHSRDSKSMCALQSTGDEDVNAEIEDSTLEAKRKATRIAIVKAAIVKTKEMWNKSSDCELRSI